MTTDGIWEFTLNDGHGYIEGHAAGAGGWFCIEADLTTLRSELVGFGFTNVDISRALMNAQAAAFERMAEPCERCGSPRYVLEVEHIDDLDAFIIEQILTEPAFADGLIVAHDNACKERNPG